MASSFRVNFPLGCLRNYEKISSVPEWLDFKCVGPAGAMSYNLANAHAFYDGNKRTALIASLVFMEANGWELLYPMN